MGDYYQNIIFPDVSKEAAPEAGQMLLRALQDEGVVQRELGDSVLGPRGGYAPAAGWQGVVAAAERRDDFFLRLRTNGMEVITAKTVFVTNWTDGIRCSCPICRADQDEAYFVVTYIKGLDEWWANDGVHALICEICGKSSEMALWTTWVPGQRRFTPFAVGFLGLKFWNWPNIELLYFEKFSSKLHSRVLYSAGK